MSDVSGGTFLLKLLIYLVYQTRIVQMDVLLVMHPDLTFLHETDEFQALPQERF